MKKILCVAAAVVIFASCNNGLNNSGGMSSKGVGQIDRSQRTSIDASKYTDFMAKNVYASKFTKQDIMYELNGTYKIAGGNSYITIDRKDGTITLSSDDAWKDGTTGHNMYAKYIFDVQAANEDCLYLKMDNKKNARMIMDFQTLINNEVPDLAVCVPLYGFSRNRMEVSPVMDGFIAMPSGTYWAEKK